MIHAVALGELLIDFIPAADSTPEQPVLKAMAGGAPGNFLAAAQAYGLKTALISKVGEDAFGEQLINTFKALGVETRGIIRDADAFTTMAFVTLDARGERSFSFARKPGADTRLKAEECDLDLIDEAKLFHFGTLSLTHQPARSATMAAVARAKAKGKLISFDPNLRPPLWKSLEDAKWAMLWGLEQADLVKISDEEVEFLFGCGAQEGASRILEQYGARLVLVTMGGKGCWYASAGIEGQVSAPNVSPVDTTGAGDIFFGSVVSRLLMQEKTLDELSEQELRAMVSFGCAAASLSTERHGGIASIPGEADVLSAMMN